MNTLLIFLVLANDFMRMCYSHVVCRLEDSFLVVIFHTFFEERKKLMTSFSPPSPVRHSELMSLI